MLIFSTLRGLPSALLAVGIFLVSLQARGGTQEITLSVDPSGAVSGEAICPGTKISFYCIAEGVVFLRWIVNGGEIKAYIGQDNAPLQQQIEGRTLILNESTPASLGLRNLTSTLVGAVGTDFQNGDRVECRDDSGQSRTLNFIQISTPPAPTAYRNTVVKNNSLIFIFIWDASFNTANNVSEYRLMASDSSVVCQESCSSEGPCQCSGFRDGVNVNINVSAVSCGDLEGPAIVISVEPQTPMETIVCRSHPVYDSSGGLVMLQIIWNRAQNPPEIAPGVSQNVMSYSASVNDDSSNITTANACQSEECSFLYSTSSILIDSTVAVTLTALNVVGGGTKSTCSLPPMNIEPMNRIFSLSLSTTDPNNRTVNCNQEYQGAGFFRCEFCLELDQRMCFNLSDNTLANAALNLLGDGTYAYYATAYIDGNPVASIFDNFSTSCQPGELGAIDVNQTDPRCDSNSASIQNGYVCYNGTVDGSLATYMCDSGYVLSGSDQRECGPDGQWSERVPLCEEASQTQYVWTTVLYVLTAVLMIASAAMAIIRFLLSLIKQLPCKVWCSFIWEGIMLPIVLILLGVFFNNTIGYSERVSLGFSFVLSVFLVIGSLIITVAIVAYYRRKSQEKSFTRGAASSDPPDNHRSDDKKEAPLD